MRKTIINQIKRPLQFCLNDEEDESTNYYERLEQLKEQNYLTNRIFGKVSENMHYEIFKYLHPEELLEIRSMNMGGYQLTSNSILRPRIKNYFVREWTAQRELSKQNIELIFQQARTSSILLDKRKLGNIELFRFSNILEVLSGRMQRIVFSILIYSYIYIYILYKLAQNEIGPTLILKLTNALKFTPELLTLSIGNIMLFTIHYILKY